MVSSLHPEDSLHEEMKIASRSVRLSQQEKETETKLIKHHFYHLSCVDGEWGDRKLLLIYLWTFHLPIVRHAIHLLVEFSQPFHPVKRDKTMNDVD